MKIDGTKVFYPPFYGFVSILAVELTVDNK